MDKSINYYEINYAIERMKTMNPPKIYCDLQSYLQFFKGRLKATN